MSIYWLVAVGGFLAGAGFAMAASHVEARRHTRRLDGELADLYRSRR